METMALFQYYNNYLDYLYHIILPDRVEGQINAIYQAIENQEPLNLGHLALLFSIIASSLFLQLSIESSVHAEACSREYTFLTGAALIQSNYSAYPTIEGLQATLIVAHNLSNTNCHPSVRVLFVHGAIVSQAKSLMLHCIDSPQFERKANGTDMIEIELKRRLWWDLASYDWLLGFLSGPQESTYLIHPEHMNVQKLANIDDIIPDSKEKDYSLPTSTPTKMSYSLERLKLAEVCREIVDATAYEHLRGREVSYDKVLELDRKLQQAYDFPAFFRLDAVSRQQYGPLYQDRPSIAWQRCLLHQAYHSRLCRLHRQYLVRGARNPTYSYSHVVCLQSARKVLEMKRIMDEDGPTFMPPSSVVWSVMHHVFMAAVILLMDVCFNWDDILAEKRKEEVLDACRMLSKAQQSSSTVREGINAMMEVLQKHWKVSNGKQSAVASSPVINPMELGNPARDSTPTAEPETANLKQSPADLPSNAIDDTGDTLEDIWTEMLDNSENLSSDTPDWTGLLAELTTATVPY
ncbi:fungal specific transcription factor domain-containing protein [Aspergillus chevalieri]|uniref:Xylanolytic transcriptional activator regulatory domain-containing protein n=1 Tax=Aspergillus chevalieri TaxID=182096 RepID=A0A7R7VNI5_ASPCH|nr:uncharacterized protein ACHE_40351A [Aspergillus chevalieri]BCR87787.1 hypothetical protein ACHE_40351A [Aspergillus chevalieri]